MKIAVIGACGRTGILVCKEAINKGHDIVGLARSECTDLKIEFALGDALKLDDIEKAIKGCDVVISVIGHVKLREYNTQTIAIKNIIKAMNNQNIKRIISLTGSGVRVKGDKISLIDRSLNIPLKIVDKSRIQDGIDHYNCLTSSNLNWTVLRVLKLTNQDKIVPYKLTAGGPAKMFVSRATVAKILVYLAESNDWSKSAPVVSIK
jgi:putative NADH-flavin reductase